MELDGRPARQIMRFYFNEIKYFRIIWYTIDKSRLFGFSSEEPFCIGG
jgi:hypothetical protein